MEEEDEIVGASLRMGPPAPKIARRGSSQPQPPDGFGLSLKRVEAMEFLERAVDELGQDAFVTQ